LGLGDELAQTGLATQELSYFNPDRRAQSRSFVRNVVREFRDQRL
jgi:hypothetical protein